MFFLLSVISFSWVLQLGAAPAPATSSSRLVHPELGLFWGKYQIDFNLSESNWLLEEEKGKDSYRFYHKKKKSSEITGQLKLLNNRISIEELKTMTTHQLQSLGLHVLGSRGLAAREGGKAEGLVFDSQLSRADRAQRIFAFEEKEKLWVLTCTTKKSLFPELVSECNQLGDRLKKAISSSKIQTDEKKSR